MIYKQVIEINKNVENSKKPQNLEKNTEKLNCKNIKSGPKIIHHRVKIDLWWQ